MNDEMESWDGLDEIPDEDDEDVWYGSGNYSASNGDVLGGWAWNSRYGW